MSRSNPTDSSPNPSTRWFEWNGESGGVRFYDKIKKQNIDLELPFTFILLDQLATVKGWDDRSESGIYANEVKDTTASPMIVKAFKGGVIAEGFYRDIRDRVAAAGGHFVANCYIAYKDDELKIGSIQFKGAALNAWVEFRNQHRKAIYDMAVTITDKKSGKKGKIVFQTPIFALKDVNEATNQKAVELDKLLQDYLKGYFQRTKGDQVRKMDGDDPEDRTDHGGGSDGRDQDGDPNFEEMDDIPF